jgi:hypothetical protein
VLQVCRFLKKKIKRRGDNVNKKNYIRRGDNVNKKKLYKEGRFFLSTLDSPPYSLLNT